MRRAWSSSRFAIPLPEAHRFPLGKYALVREMVVALGVLPSRAIEEPERAAGWSLELVHTPGYVDTILQGTLSPGEIRRLGFPWGAELRERALRTVQGTLEAANDALRGGAGVNLAGGTHHAFPDHGEGFCVFNDVAVAIRTLQHQGRVRRAAVIDLDVHQGNGTAAIFGGDPNVFTFSMHGDRNYPFPKAFSRLDVGLADGCRDPEYLGVLDRHLGEVLEESRPELVFYLAGADPYQEDRLGRLKLSMDGLRRRDRAVFQACRRRALPVAMTLAGGYARSIEDIATIHVNTLRELRLAYG